jgi:site-specific recombinase XerD
LRHSCASTLVNAGIEIPVIAKILGHKTLSMTMRYSHINDSSVKDAMAVLDHQQLQQKEKRTIKIKQNG